MSEILKFGIGLIALIGICVLQGLAISLTWGWFVVPVFPLPPINIVESIGIAFVAVAIKPSISTSNESDLVEQFSRAFSQPLLVITFGYILTFFI